MQARAGIIAPNVDTFAWVFLRRNRVLNMMWPILVVVSANVFYNIIAKSTPNAVQPFASLVITYFTAAIVSFILFFLASEDKNITNEIQKANWTSVAFGLALVALEFGYIYVYRVGWKISIGSLVANISLAFVLLLVGIIVFKESISLRQIFGMVMCIGGLFLISK